MAQMHRCLHLDDKPLLETLARLIGVDLEARLVDAERNSQFRKQLPNTTEHVRVVAYHLAPDAVIPLETHDDIAQLIIVVQGTLRAQIHQKTATSKQDFYVWADEAIMIPPNTPHIVTNSSRGHTKFLSLYIHTLA